MCIHIDTIQSYFTEIIDQTGNLFTFLAVNIAQCSHGDVMSMHNVFPRNSPAFSLTTNTFRRCCEEYVGQHINRAIRWTYGTIGG